MVLTGRGGCRDRLLATTREDHLFSSGALTGRNKRSCSEEFGLAQVQRWRRSVSEAPPPLEAEAAAALLDGRCEHVACARAH